VSWAREREPRGEEAPVEGAIKLATEDRILVNRPDFSMGFRDW